MIKLIVVKGVSYENITKELFDKSRTVVTQLANFIRKDQQYEVSTDPDP